MRPLIAALLAILAACSLPMTYVEYQEPGGDFSVQVPSHWAIDERGAFSRKPVGEVWWMGKVVDQHEGIPIGVMLFVRRIDRRSTGTTLAETDALFSGKHPKDVLVQSLEFSGKTARAFNRDYEETLGGGMHGKLRSYPARTAGVAIQTPDAYYVLEYRAVRDQFDKYFPIFERLRSSFKILR